MIVGHMDDPIHVRAKYVATWVNPTDEIALLVEERFGHRKTSLSRLSRIRKPYFFLVDFLTMFP